MYSYFSHPNNVCMSYCNHFLVSINYSKIFIFAGIKALIHAFFPNIFITSTTDCVNNVSKLLKNNNCNK